MASSSAELGAAAAVAARDARLGQRTDALGLQHLINSATKGYLFWALVLFLAFLAAHEGAIVWAGIWLAVAAARQLHLLRLARGLASAARAPPRELLAQLERTYFLEGLVWASLLPVFFARSSETVLLGASVLGLIPSGALHAAASGLVRMWVGFSAPIFGVLIVGWLWRGGPVGIVVACVLAGIFPLRLMAMRSQRRASMEMVRLLDDNERLSAELEAQRDRAEAASESKTRFFAAASHDLRQPLHALSINATTLDLVARRSGDGLLLGISQGISTSLRQSRSLLDGLLDISRLDAHAVKLRLAPVDIAALLDALKDEYAGIAKAHGLTLAVELEAEAELLWALTDADQLNRVLGNLVDNALKFTAQGGVVLSTQRTAAGQVLVQVTDTGPGIAPEEQERVFDEFYQAGNPSRDRSQGLGLGLAIVRRTAALLQIGLRLASAPGQGTTFEVSLAATKPDPNETSTLPSPDASAALSVLLVDDEPDVVSSLCRYLREIGWAAEGATNGAEAEAILARGFSADVLVVDYRLRDETCVELIARLRVRCGQVPVVVVTGDSRTQGLRELEGLAAAILHKPVDGAALSGALVEAVRRQPGA